MGRGGSTAGKTTTCMCRCLTLCHCSRVPPSLSCGPWRVYSREDYYMYVSVSDTVSLFQGSPVPQLWASGGSTAGKTTTCMCRCLTLCLTLCHCSRVPPSVSCGPWRVYSREDYYMYVSVSDTVSLFQGSPVPQLWAVEGLQQGRLLHVCVGV